MTCLTEFNPDFCKQDIHGWFGLSYANYLVLHRSLMQEMPAAWQHEFTRLLGELHEAFPAAPSSFWVRLKDNRGKFVADPLANYRYPNRAAVEAARGQQPEAAQP